MKQHTKRIILTVLISIAVLVAGVITFVFIVTLPPSHPDFQLYIPSQKLSSEAIQSKELTRVRHNGLDIWSFEYRLDYPDARVYERPGKGVPVGCKYWAASSGDTDIRCHEGILANGGKYAVVASRDKGDLYGLDISAIVGTTSFYIALSDNQYVKYENYDWKGYFESMQPQSSQNIPFGDAQQHDGGG